MKKDEEPKIINDDIYWNDCKLDDIYCVNCKLPILECGDVNNDGDTYTIYCKNCSYIFNLTGDIKIKFKLKMPNNKNFN